MTLTLLIEYEIMNIFMEESCRKYVPKAIPRPLFILVNNPKQSIYARNYFKNQEMGLSKPLEKINFIFAFEPSPF